MTHTSSSLVRSREDAPGSRTACWLNAGFRTACKSGAFCRPCFVPLQASTSALLSTMTTCPVILPFFLFHCIRESAGGVCCTTCRGVNNAYRTHVRLMQRCVLTRPILHGMAHCHPNQELFLHYHGQTSGCLCAYHPPFSQTGAVYVQYLSVMRMQV